MIKLSLRHYCFVDYRRPVFQNYVKYQIYYILKVEQNISKPIFRLSERFLYD